MLCRVEKSEECDEIRTLTSTSDGEHDLGRMPSTDTSDLAETLVCFSRQPRGTPSVCNTLETVTLGNRNNINNLVLLEHARHLDWLLEKALRVGDLVSHRPAVHLDLHQVGLLLLQARLSDLGVCENTNDSAVLANALKLTSNGFAVIFGVFLGVTGESLFLGSVPVFVEAAF